MKEIVGLKAKAYSYLKDNNNEDTKKCIRKRKITLAGYKNCLEAAYIDNEINHLEKNKIDSDSPK